jgi:hypothetical protein
MNPLAGVTHAVYFLALTMALRLPVAVAASNSGATYPLVYASRRAPAGDGVAAARDVAQQRREDGRAARTRGEREREPREVALHLVRDPQGSRVEVPEEARELDDDHLEEVQAHGDGEEGDENRQAVADGLPVRAPDGRGGDAEESQSRRQTGRERRAVTRGGGGATRRGVRGRFRVRGRVRVASDVADGEGEDRERARG